MGGNPTFRPCEVEMVVILAIDAILHFLSPTVRVQCLFLKSVLKFPKSSKVRDHHLYLQFHQLTIPYPPHSATEEFHEGRAINARVNSRRRMFGAVLSLHSLLLVQVISFRNRGLETTRVLERLAE